MKQEQDKKTARRVKKKDKKKKPKKPKSRIEEKDKKKKPPNPQSPRNYPTSPHWWFLGFRGLLVFLLLLSFFFLLFLSIFLFVVLIIVPFVSSCWFWVGFFTQTRNMPPIFVEKDKKGIFVGKFRVRGHIYIYIIASNPIGWAIFRGENVKEQREKRKTMAEKGKDEKEEETLKHEKPPPFWWGCFVAIFDYKTWDFLRFFTNICPPSGVRAIYIYIYACCRVKTWSKIAFF